MKKIFVSMMLAAALLTGGMAYAQTDGTTGATQKENVGKNIQNAPLRDQSARAKKEGQKGPKMGKKNKQGKPMFNPFEGVQLTEDQQQRLQVLQQGLGPVQLTPEEKAKIKENPNLTPEQKKQLKAERKAKKLEAKKKYLSGVKETLTPDQYVIFLENCYLYAPQGHSKDKGMKHHKDGRKEGKKAKKAAEK